MSAAEPLSDPRGALEPALAHLRGAPSRTWSLVITFFGDAVVPRGGDVSLAALLTFFDAVGIAPGVVRTALSRLTADGWLIRDRAGRTSRYRLAERGLETFRDAEARIYSARPPQWSGAFTLLLAGESGLDERARAALAAAGFGAPSPGVWIAPPGVRVPDEAAGALVLSATGESEANRALAAKAWPPERGRRAYETFLAAFSPLRRFLAEGRRLAGLDALAARVLLVHAYRRILLGGPDLPAALLAPDWPGARARALCAEVYPLLLPASEAWLDANVLDDKGSRTRAAPPIATRFR